MAASAGEMLSINLKLLRQAKGLSLSELARQSGIGKATLSQLESGAGNPTLETVFTLAQTLDTPVSDLLQGPSASPVTVVRSGESEVLSGGGVELQLVRRQDGQLDVLEVFNQRFAAGCDRGSSGHLGWEHTIVKSGELTVEFSEASYVLGSGDSVEFDGRLAHRYRAQAGPVDSVLILTYAGRRGLVAGQDAHGELN